MRKRAPEPSGGSSDWMTTFSDLITLLLTFFVLLLTMSSMDNKKLRDTFGFFSGTVGHLAGSRAGDLPPIVLVSPPALLPNTFDVLLGHQEIPTVQGRDETIEELLKQAAERAVRSELVEVERTDEGVALRLAGTIAFDPATAQLTPETRRLLLDVADLASVAKLSVVAETRVSPQGRQKEFAWRRAALLGDQVASFLDARGHLPGERITLRAYGRATDAPIGGETTALTVTLVAFGKEHPDG